MCWLGDVLREELKQLKTGDKKQGCVGGGNASHRGVVPLSQDRKEA